ncbi:hypothetical protein [Undibacter mobilis]|uniref:hypothetical protein n=1 Tax=Undibacter mobilis TaxID=2292256 RepID=UPI0011C044C0|nr:hypothetical protein [Undibacter mobilis]
MTTKDALSYATPSIVDISDEDTFNLQQNRQYVIKILLESRDIYLRKRDAHELPEDLTALSAPQPLIFRFLHALRHDQQSKAGGRK